MVTEEEKKQIVEMGKNDLSPETSEKKEDVEKSTDNTEGESESEQDDEGKDSQPDWEAIAKAEEEKRKELEKKMSGDAYRYRKEKREEREEEQPEEETPDEEAPLTRGEFYKALRQQREETERMTQEQKALEIARGNTRSEAEAQAAIAFWKNRVQPSGDLQDDILFAIGGMHRQASSAREAELKRALQSRDTASRETAGGSYRESIAAGEPKLSSDIKTVIQQGNYKWDGNKKLYKRLLARGKFLYYDPKTGKNFRE